MGGGRGALLRVRLDGMGMVMVGMGWDGMGWGVAGVEVQDLKVEVHP